jgi:hypothetical protein
MIINQWIDNVLEIILIILCQIIHKLINFYSCMARDLKIYPSYFSSCLINLNVLSQNKTFLKLQP